MDLAFGYGTADRLTGENNDTLGAFRLGDWTLLLVCDGQGSPSAASQASTIATLAILEAVSHTQSEPGEALTEALLSANRAIYEEARKNHRLMGMSTSVVAILIADSAAYVAHVGNCRAYLSNGGQGQILTRDHTMVNMFVDNELLSPEDAASHPEAHVLSRTLGAERQVEVDLQVVDLADGDVIILCSDGVHRYVDNESQIWSDNWASPERAAKSVIRRAHARGGSDAATLVGVRIGGQGDPGMGPTPLPSTESSGDAPTPMSLDEIHTPALFDEPQPPALYPLDDETTAGTDATAGTDQPPLAHQIETPRAQPPRVSSMPEVVRTAPAKPEPIPPVKRTNKKRRLILVGLSAILVLCILILVGAVVTRQVLDRAPAQAKVDPSPEEGAQAASSSGPEPEPKAEEPQPQTQTQELEQPAEPEPSFDEPSGSEVDITRSPGEFARIRFPTLRRNFRTPQIYTHAPPSPAPRISIQNEIGRGSGCAGVEEIIKDSLRRSPAFSPLYRDLWNCYRDLHDPHVGGQLTSAIHFIDKRPHLEGQPVQPNPDRPLPLWYLPAQDGIERRMDLYDESAGVRDGFHDVINDAIDPEIIASRFHYDLMALAAYAAAFSNLPNPTSAQIQDWARRVYYTRKHRDSAVGRLVQELDPAADRRIRDVLAAATFDFEQTYRNASNNWLSENPGSERESFDWQDLAGQRRLPVEVAQAVLVGAKLIPPPTATRPQAKPDEAEKPKPVVRKRDPCEVNPTDPLCIP
ncbi:MAG: serine/threonine-protein phosphatase [Deltaproteobacteria bacterium]|nr:MAG: serine/threonine-protein phosphatase [Deltaproteobacteria bacterium]